MSWQARVLYLLSTACGIWYILPRAFAALKRRRPDIDLLMTVAVIGAIAIGEYLEAAVESFLFAASLALESWSIARARRAFAALMSLAPETALVNDESGTETRRPVAEVQVGSRVIVCPGEKFPLDGRVFKGNSSVNQVPITGESLPVSKGPGDDVFAGTINEEGALLENIADGLPGDRKNPKLAELAQDPTVAHHSFACDPADELAQPKRLPAPAGLGDRLAARFSLVRFADPVTERRGADERDDGFNGSAERPAMLEQNGALFRRDDNSLSGAAPA